MNSTVACKGYCHQCQTIHSLPQGNSERYARLLMEDLQRLQNIDFTSKTPHSCYDTSPLFGDNRGKMFGVLECTNNKGERIVLKAFSGQFHGLWQAPGWVAPLFDPVLFYEVNDETEKKIKKLSHEIDVVKATGDLPNLKELKRVRKQLSQQLMINIHEIYSLSNFCGQTTTLQKASSATGGIPTGTGDCCAPKLLNHAAKNNLHPIGLTEFFWGKENRSQSRKHGSIYQACKEKCEPILGFLLCGSKK